MKYRLIRYSYLEVVSGAKPKFFSDPWVSVRRIAMGGPYWRPPADYYETEQGLVVKVELPGVAEDEVEMTAYRDVLLLEGVRSNEAPVDARYHAAEIRYGRFRLEVPLPDSVDREQIVGRMDRGFLTIDIPKKRG